MLTSKDMKEMHDETNPASPKPVKVEGQQDGNVTEFGDKPISCFSPSGIGKIAKPNVLEEASSLTSGARNKTYGPPVIDYGRVVAIFNAITGNSLTPEQGLLFMLCVKLSREMHLHKRDNLVDACGYLRLYSMLKGDEE